jgi:starvation-inducible DNA-binding protein
MTTKSEVWRSHASGSPLPEEAREDAVGALQACLVDGIDLYSQLKVAHWNVKGPQFAALHAQFDSFARSVDAHNDAVAERVVALGGTARGTVREAARGSSLPEYPPDAVRDMEHVRLLVERFREYMATLREARDMCGARGDVGSVDMLTAIVTDFEKHAWFLLASLER